MTYSQWFEITSIVRSEQLGRRDYLPGVERAAALAAIDQETHGCGVEACIAAVERAFASMCVSINPRWDGSIA